MTGPEQSNMDLSRPADQMTLLQRAELDILAGFCANPERYRDMEKKVQILTREYQIKLIKKEFDVEDDEAALIILGNTKVDKDKAWKIKSFEKEAKNKAHITATKKNIKKAKLIALAWYEVLDEK